MHLGYTGTMICIDPENELFTIFLTNRVYPTDANHRIGSARRAFSKAVVDAFQRRAAVGGPHAPLSSIWVAVIAIVGTMTCVVVVLAFRKRLAQRTTAQSSDAGDAAHTVLLSDLLNSDAAADADQTARTEV